MNKEMEKKDECLAVEADDGLRCRVHEQPYVCPQAVEAHRARVHDAVLQHLAAAARRGDATPEELARRWLSETVSETGPPVVVLADVQRRVTDVLRYTKDDLVIACRGTVWEVACEILVREVRSRMLVAPEASAKGP